MSVYPENPNWGGIYTWGVLDMGAGNITKRIPCPYKRKPYIHEVSGHVTETFTETTTPGIIQLGYASGATLNDYFEVLDMGVTAADVTLSSSDQSGIFKNALIRQLGEVDQDVIVTLTAPTGGTPAGMIELFVAISWH